MIRPRRGNFHSDLCRLVIHNGVFVARHNYVIFAPYHLRHFSHLNQATEEQKFVHLCKMLEGFNFKQIQLNMLINIFHCVYIHVIFHVLEAYMHFVFHVHLCIPAMHFQSLITRKRRTCTKAERTRQVGIMHVPNTYCAPAGRISCGSHALSSNSSVY